MDKLQDMKIIVTGASGFIGKEIVAELQKENFEIIRLVSPKSEAKSDNLEEALTKKSTFFVDISDYKNFRELEKLKNVEAIIHSAGLAHQFGITEKQKFEAVNVRGTENVARLSAKIGVRQFILIGSTAVYGIKRNVKGIEKNKNSLAFDENSDCYPETDYAQSKLDGERVCIKICGQNKIPLTIFRLAPVIGEGNSGNVERLIRSIDKKRFLWIGKGNNLKSLIYKGDVAKACRRILSEKKGETEIFNLAAQPLPMNEIVNEIASALGKKVPGFYIPPSFLKAVFGVNTKIFGFRKIDKLALTVEKWLSDDIYAANKIADVYGFYPETPIKEAISKQVKSYLKQKNSSF